MTDTPLDTRPPVWTMAVVHQYYRREFELAPRIVRDLGPDEVLRHERAAQWFATTVAMMHHHHVTEDATMYPLLVARAPGPLLDRMEAQHQRVAEAVDAVEVELLHWRLDDPESGERLAAAFDALVPPLLEHLDAEEQQVMPLVEEYLTGDEYSVMGTSGNDLYDATTLMRAFGAMIEQADEAETEEMLAQPPPHVVREWHDHGARDYRQLMQLLRGQLEPMPRRRT